MKEEGGKRQTMRHLFEIWQTTKNTLFPWLEEILDPLTEKEREFVHVVQLAEIQKHMGPYRWEGMGLAIAKAFIAKAVYNCPATKGLITLIWDSKNSRRLCGWERYIQNRRILRLSGPF